MENPDHIFDIETRIFTIFPNTIQENDIDYLYCLYQNPNIITYDYKIMRKNKKTLHINFYSFYYKNLFKKLNNDCINNIINYIYLFIAKFHKFINSFKFIIK